MLIQYDAINVDALQPCYNCLQAVHQNCRVACTATTTSQNTSGVPAVLVPIIHVVQCLHLLLSELPAQQLTRACLSNVRWIQRLWYDSTALL